MEIFLSHLECSNCEERHSSYEIQSVCRSCGKPLLARYDLQSAKQRLTKEWFRSLPSSLWKFFPLLPLEKQENIVSLGEETTPVLRLNRVGKHLGIREVWLKDEGHLPTGSFKARGLSMAVSKAKELGIAEVCIPSAGNAGGALAAYAARGGIKSHVFIPSDTPSVNIKECQAYGSTVKLCDGNISHAAKAMNEERKTHPEWFDVSTLREPYRLEGKKTMGYELAEQFEWNLPEVIVYPTGGGTGLIGMWKAFNEMQELGWIDSRRPQMVSVQAEGCAPIVKAFEQGKKESAFWENAQTIASGLKVPKAFADALILDAIYQSNGSAVSVSDAEIRRTILEVATLEGILLCPEGAAAAAALEKLLGIRFFAPTDRVVLFNTAAGNKYPDLIR